MSNVRNETSTEPRVLDMSNVEDAILARWEDADESQPSEDEQGATPEPEEETQGELEFEEAEEPDEELEEEEDSEVEADDDTETEDESDDDTVIDISDETEVEVLVDGEQHSISIGQLKRLAGQEKSLTRKSQETARQRKEAEDAIGKGHVLMQKMLENAQERWKPYQDVDMLVASKTMDAEDFAQLRKEAGEAYNDLKFLTEEADSFYKDAQDRQKVALQDAAKECVKTLQDSIPDWSNELYNDIRTYAVAQGLPEEQVNQYVDPNVIMLLNKARLYDQGKRVATVKKKAATTKKVLRTKKAPANAQAQRKAKADKQRDALRANGGNDLEDIAEALLGRWAT